MGSGMGQTGMNLSHWSSLAELWRFVDGCGLFHIWRLLQLCHHLAVRCKRAAEMIIKYILLGNEF